MLSPLALVRKTKQWKAPIRKPLILPKFPSFLCFCILHLGSSLGHSTMCSMDNIFISWITNDYPSLISRFGGLPSRGCPAFSTRHQACRQNPKRNRTWQGTIGLITSYEGWDTDKAGKAGITVGAIYLIRKEKVGSRRQGVMLVINRKQRVPLRVTKCKDKILTYIFSMGSKGCTWIMHQKRLTSQQRVTESMGSRDKMHSGVKSALCGEVGCAEYSSTERIPLLVALNDSGHSLPTRKADMG